eukprot:COSAG05_NODE_97_length_19444_cov_8.577174_3_plen_264_part_00
MCSESGPNTCCGGDDVVVVVVCVRVAQLLHGLYKRRVMGAHKPTLRTLLYTIFNLEAHAWRSGPVDKKRHRQKKGNKDGVYLQDIRGLNFHMVLERLTLLHYGKKRCLSYAQQVREWTQHRPFLRNVSTPSCYLSTCQSRAVYSESPLRFPVWAVNTINACRCGSTTTSCSTSPSTSSSPWSRSGSADGAPARPSPAAPGQGMPYPYLFTSFDCVSESTVDDLCPDVSGGVQQRGLATVSRRVQNRCGRRDRHTLAVLKRAPQ